MAEKEYIERKAVYIGDDIAKCDMNCCGELLVEDKCINAVYDLWFDVDEIFGIECNEDYWINLYTDWYPDENIIIIVNLETFDKTEDLPVKWSKEAENFFRNKMEQYSLKCYGKTLAELFEEHKK